MPNTKPRILQGLNHARKGFDQLRAFLDETDWSFEKENVSEVVFLADEVIEDSLQMIDELSDDALFDRLQKIAKAGEIALVACGRLL